MLIIASFVFFGYLLLDLRGSKFKLSIMCNLYRLVCSDISHGLELVPIPASNLFNPPIAPGKILYFT
jgi:hypothetical protein